MKPGARRIGVPPRRGLLTLALALLALGGLLAIALVLWLLSTPVAPAPPRPDDASARVAATASTASGGDAPRGPRPPPPAALPTAVPAAESRGRTLEGRVTASSDLPLQGVSVRLTLAPAARPPKSGGNGVARARDVTGVTDAQGEYRITDAEGPALRLEFSAQGFETRLFERPALPDAPRVRWDVTLNPAGGVHGLVTSPEGPVAGAVLGLFPPGADRVSTVARSDSHGRFNLVLPERPGPYKLKARHEAHGEATVSVAGPGEITVRLPGGGAIEGHVFDSTREPVQAFSLSAAPSERRMLATPVAQSFDSGDGSFRLGPLAAGKYALRAAAEGFQPGEPVTVVVTGGQTTSGVELLMRASGTLTGRVIDARTRRPISGAVIAPAEWSDGSLSDSVGATTGADGRYTLKALPGKRSSLNVSALGYRSLLGGGVVVPPGKTVTRDFALTPQGNGQAATSELTGIGAVLATRPDGVAITNIVEGAPAARGLREGDVVVMVDQTSTAGLPLGEVANAIRGDLGTDVTLWVKRGGAGNPERVVIRRDRVSMPERNGGGPHGPHDPKRPHGEPEGED